MTKVGTLDTRKELRTVLKNQGIQGMYRGYWAFFWRDIPGWAVYFGAYEQLRIWNEILNKKRGGDEDTMRRRMNWLQLNAGGLAGVLSWVIAIP